MPTAEQLGQQRRRHLQSLRQHLAEVEEEQGRLEQRGVELEMQLRSKEDIDVDDQLVEEWFSLVNQKNQVLRQVCPSTTLPTSRVANLLP